MFKRKISVFCLGVLFSLLITVDTNTQASTSAPVFVPIIKANNDISNQEDREKHYDVEVVYDLNTLISIANSIGIDRVYNENYSLDVNKQVKVFYEYMNEAEKLAKNKEGVKEVNNEYVKRIASSLAQQDVNPNMLFYLRYSYCKKISASFPELKTLSAKVDEEYNSRKKKENEDKRLEEKRKKVTKRFIESILLIFIFLIIYIVYKLWI